LSMDLIGIETINNSLGYISSAPKFL